MVDGAQILHLRELDSTNTKCNELARQGQQSPIWVLADRQSQGRGRFQRTWQSGAGNLYASGLYFFPRAPADLAQLGFAAALAGIDALANFIPADELHVKWPNDIMLDGAKLAGILPESGQHMGQNYLVMGIGINLGFAPKITGVKTACLAKHRLCRAAPRPIDFLPSLISAFEKWVQIWETEGFEPLRRAWLSRAYGLGEMITTSDGQSGTFEDMRKNGALLLRNASGRAIEISAGEVFFPNQ